MSQLFKQYILWQHRFFTKYNLVSVQSANDCLNHFLMHSVIVIEDNNRFVPAYPALKFTDNRIHPLPGLSRTPFNLQSWKFIVIRFSIFKIHLLFFRQ